MGGECRVEIEFTAIANEDKTVKLTGTVKLFEGTFEETPDLEDEKPVDFSVPIGGIARTYQQEVKGQGVGGGDSATVRFVFTNTEGRTYIPGELIAAPGFPARGALPHPNEIAVDNAGRGDDHKLYDDAHPDPAMRYSTQYVWRKALATRHIRQAFAAHWPG